MYSLRQVVAPIFKALAPAPDTDLYGTHLRQQLEGASRFRVGVLLQGAADLKLKIKERAAANQVVTILKAILANTYTEVEFDVDSKFEYNLQLGAGVAMDLVQVSESRSGA